MTLTTEERLMKARLWLNYNKPFFGYVSMYLKFRRDDNMPHKTMGVDPRGNLYYDKSFVDKLSDEELRGVLLHEVEHCLHPDTIVWNKRIKDLIIGDDVICNDGKIHKVLKRGKIKYNGNMLEIKPVGFLPIKITENHMILVYNTNINKLEWKLSQKVDKDTDMLLMPKLKKSNHNTNIFNIKKYIHGNAWSVPEKLYNLKLNNNIAFIIGLIIADGSTSVNKNDNTICISLNSNNKKLISKVSNILENDFGLSVRYTYKNNQDVCYIKVSSNILKRFIRNELGTYSHNKQIPDWVIHASKSIVHSFIHGLYSGDGCVCSYDKPKHTCINYCTINKILATQLQLLLNRDDINIHTTLRKRHDGDMHIRGKTYKTKSKYILSTRDKKMYNIINIDYNKKRPTKYYKDIGNYIATKIKYIKSYNYDGYVYNIHTNPENYIANNIIVHNCILCHFERMDTRNHDIWNRATDCVINYQIIEEGLKLPKCGLIPKHDGKITLIGKEFNVKDKSSEEFYGEIYNHLKNNMNNGSCNGDCSKCQNGNSSGSSSGTCNKLPNGFDEHKYGDGKGDDEKGDRENGMKHGTEGNMTAEDWKRALSRARAMNRGNIPAGMERMIDELLNPKMDWKVLLNKFVGESIPFDFSLLRPHKKSFSVGAYLPHITKQKTKVLVNIDTSGSVSQKDLTEFMSEVVGIIQTFNNNIEMTVIYSDTKVYKAKTFFNPTVEDILSHMPKGGGGTDHKVVFDFIRKNYPDAKLVVCLTDGDTRFPDYTPERDVIWVLGGDWVTNKDMPFGRTLRIPKG